MILSSASRRNRLAQMHSTASNEGTLIVSIVVALFPRRDQDEISSPECFMLTAVALHRIRICYTHICIE